jgi:PAS domain S-box-containing protein
MCRTSITDISELKQAEQKLQESERLFAAFMAHLPSLAVIRDLEGRCLFANAAWERAFQKSREKWWGETTDDLWPPEIPAKFKQPDQLVMKTGEALHTLGPLPHPDGLHHWISKRFPIVDQDRQPVIIGINAIDVTGQLATQTLLERFLASSPAAIYACEVTGIFAPTYISITSRDWWVGTPWSGPKSSFRAACGRHDWRAQRPLHAWRRLHLAGTGAQARSLRYQKWQAGGLPYQTLNNL